MLNKEEIEKANMWVEERIKYIAQNCDLKDESNKRVFDNLKVIKICLQENNKLNKIIDEMAYQLTELHNLSEDDCFIPREYSDINDCIKKASCFDCIKQYFEKKVDENVK